MKVLLELELEMRKQGVVAVQATAEYSITHLNSRFIGDVTADPLKFLEVVIALETQIRYMSTH